MNGCDQRFSSQGCGQLWASWPLNSYLTFLLVLIYFYLNTNHATAIKTINDSDNRNSVGIIINTNTMGEQFKGSVTTKKSLSVATPSVGLVQHTLRKAQSPRGSEAW